jgi:hypothetical protein
MKRTDNKYLPKVTEPKQPDPLKVAVQAKSNGDGMPIVVALFGVIGVIILRLLGLL